MPLKYWASGWRAASEGPFEDFPGVTALAERNLLFRRTLDLARIREWHLAHGSPFLCISIFRESF